MDLNGLKRINDQQGHDSGDKYIRDISRIFSRYFRGDDLFRIGGDEFVFLCPNIPERVFYAKIAALQREANKAYPESLSLGQVWAEGDMLIMDMVRQADKRMYQEKAEYHARRGDTV
ncbi:GGDEF domain-containing protein [Bilophila wadsworthia]|uniref:GGDEF domain-containing protein n=1 Tax=Bilophila wadsworthia TaxID=35833 RepID=UPI0039904A3D